MKWKYEVKVFNDPKWYSNDIEYDSWDQAKAASELKLYSWTQVVETRVVEVPEHRTLSAKEQRKLKAMRR